MNGQATGFQCTSLVQQGYDYTPKELKQLSWGLRFTPIVCMALAIVGLATRQPVIHFVLAALGILPFWFPAGHPVDLLYNHALRPLWNGVKLPPNPLPRRIACFMGGAMNLGIGAAFVLDSVTVAYILGAVLVVLQLVVITTHFCIASWMYEAFLRSIGRWTAPIAVEKARELLSGGGQLIDVRSPEEFAQGHLPGSHNVPLERVVDELAEKGDRCLVLCCRSGLRSQRATQLLKRRNHPNVHNLGAMARLESDGSSESAGP